MTFKTAIVVDNGSLTKWQADALDTARSKLDIVCVLNCQNTKTKKQFGKHFGYYVLNVLALKNKATARQPLSIDGAEVIDFSSIYDGNWQSFPQHVIDMLVKNDIQLVIKFGMNLLRIDDQLPNCTVLSYHHGNPSRYRGRPAGFYEILNGEKTSGIIVQKLSNQLDAGQVFAFAQSKVVNFSYKRTALNFYSNSKNLLAKAIDNIANDTPVEIATDGTNYKLPSNPVVLRFCLRLLANTLRKLAYGLFFEKAWKVGTTDNILRFDGDEVLLQSDITELPIADGYTFYADPFFDEEGHNIRLEGLRNDSGQGDILEIPVDAPENVKILLTGAHYSYPFSFQHTDRELLLPEVASHSAQYFLDPAAGDAPQMLKGFEDKRIVDATLFRKDDTWYLFFGLQATAHTVLHLWSARDLSAEFTPHPNSPIAISPALARMGGRIVATNGRVIRLGQNNEGEYGEALAVLEITELTPTTYAEVLRGTIVMDAAKGPHSLDISPDGKKLVVDYYKDVFSVFAGVRRIKAKLRKR